MVNRLFYFLIALSENLELQREYNLEPDAVMARYGLSEGEKTAVLTGNVDDVRAMADIGANFGLRKHCGVYPKPPKKKPRRSKKAPRKSKKAPRKAKR